MESEYFVAGIFAGLMLMTITSMIFQLVVDRIEAKEYEQAKIDNMLHRIKEVERRLDEDEI